MFAPRITMARSPPRNPWSPYSQSMPECPLAGIAQLEIPEQPVFDTLPTTQYKFIVQTGDESAATTKRKLKTVRSHVMKNYLHQQQQSQQSKGTGSSSLATGTDRRKGKQRARSSRSGSRDTESSTSPTMSKGMRGRSASASTGIGPTTPGSFLPMHLSGSAHTAQADNGFDQRFALDFNFVAPSDEVSTFAQMYVSCVAQDRKSGLLQPSFETLHAKGEAIRMAQDIIGACGNQVPQSIIFAITLLAQGCGADQAWDEARGHVEALQHLLDMRGGIRTLDFELQRTVSWTTYSLSAALQIPPRLPPSMFPNFRPCPLAFHDDAQIRAWRTAKRFPKNTSFVFDLVLRLHQLGLATSLEWYNVIDQRTLSNLYFETMHSAVVVPLEEPWNETLPNGIQGQEAATMFKVWAAGLPLFVWATARQAKAQNGMNLPRSRYDPIFARIRAMLESTGSYNAWPRGKSLEPIMATLVYAVEACEYGDLWRPWCVDTLRRVVELLRLKAVEDFRKALEFFPTTEIILATAGDLWSEIMHGSVASTPTLTLPAMK